MGSSWGGLLSQVYAARRPERVEEQVLIGSAPATYDTLQAGGQRFSERVSELQEDGAIEAPLPPDLGGYLEAMLPAYFADGRDVPTEAQVPIAAETYRAIADANLAPGFDHTSEVATVEAPVRILVGDVDPFGVEMSDDVREQMQRSEPVQIIEGCGHWPRFYCLDATVAAMLD